MKNTHTPGPWETIKRCTGFYDIGVPKAHRCEGEAHWIATVWERDEKHAFNARLIAEAPAMLEALRAIATYMRGDLTTDDFKAFGLKRGDMTGNVRRIAENVLTRIDGEAAQ